MCHFFLQESFKIYFLFYIIFYILQRSKSKPQKVYSMSDKSGRIYIFSLFRGFKLEIHLAVYSLQQIVQYNFQNTFKNLNCFS